MLLSSVLRCVYVLVCVDARVSFSLLLPRVTLENLKSLITEDDLAVSDCKSGEELEDNVGDSVGDSVGEVYTVDGPSVSRNWNSSGNAD